MSAKTAAEVDSLARTAYLVYSRIGDPAWHQLPSLEQEKWRAVVRELVSALK